MLILFSLRYGFGSGKKKKKDKWIFYKSEGYERAQSVSLSLKKTMIPSAFSTKEYEISLTEVGQLGNVC